MFNIQVMRKGNRIAPPVNYQSLQTDGSQANGYATIPSIAAYGTFSDFTWEFWISRGAWNSTNGRIIDFDYFNGWTSNRSGTTDKLSMGGKSGAVVASTSDLLQDTWTHIAFVRSGSTGIIYFNGVSDNSGGVSNGTFAYTVLANFFIGEINGTGAPQTFKMTDLRFWKEARSEAQIAANMNTHLVGNETNLIGNWQFIGGSLADSTANDNTMALQANASIVNTNPY
jgi:hypothetical protein